MEDKDLERFFGQLGARLRDRRVRLGYTQEDMIGFGFSARHWQQIEAGRPITLTTLLRACEALSVRPSTLLRQPEAGLPAWRKKR